MATTSDGSTTTDSTHPEEMDVYNLDRTQETIFQTNEGTIHVIHEITLGDILTCTLLLMMLGVMFLSKVMRR